MGASNRKQTIAADITSYACPVGIYQIKLSVYAVLLTGKPWEPFCKNKKGENVLLKLRSEAIQDPKLRCFEINKKFGPSSRWGMMRGVFGVFVSRIAQADSKPAWLMMKGHVHVHFRGYIDAKLPHMMSEYLDIGSQSHNFQHSDIIQ